MNVEQIIKEYSEKHSDKSYSRIADLILAGEDNVELSHRTLRQKVSSYLNSKEECCGDPLVCEAACEKTAFINARSQGKSALDSDGKIKYQENSWNKESTLDYFKKQQQYPVTPKESYKVLQPYVGGDKNNVLVIGDTHLPFEKEGYIDHCRQVQERFNCGTIVHIGDFTDQNYSSFHDSNPDGYSAGEELNRAIVKAREWHRIFPNTKVTLGNHCSNIMRKAFASGVSSRWIKGMAEVLETPTWEYDTEFTINGVLYTHTLGGNLLNAAMARRQSVVCGHLHTKAEIQWNVNKKDKIFSMQVGTGIDDTAYAFNYAKLVAKKSIVSCAVVLDSGTLPIIIPMEL